MYETGRPHSFPEQNPPATGRTARLTRRVLDALGRNWRDTVYLQARLLEAQRPWEQQGPLHWRRQLGGGWRMVGSYLPEAEGTGSPAVPGQSP
jgi:hypothetical protein